MIPMTEMSRAILGVINNHAPTLKTLPDDVLDDFTKIVGAFAMDLRNELERRKQDRPYRHATRES